MFATDLRLQPLGGCFAAAQRPVARRPRNEASETGPFWKWTLASASGKLQATEKSEDV